MEQEHVGNLGYVCLTTNQYDSISEQGIWRSVTNSDLNSLLGFTQSTEDVCASDGKVCEVVNRVNTFWHCDLAHYFAHHRICPVGH
jgi:hypothetical protein